MFAVALAACGYDDFRNNGAADFPGTESLPNADLSLLYDHYYGEPFTVKEDMVFEGYVIADDGSGNFFRSFIIDDGTSAAEVRAGYYDLHTVYPVGRRIILHAKALGVGKYNGVIQIGVGINSYTPYRVEEFGARAVLEKYVERDVNRYYPDPLPVDAGSLSADMCGRLVRTAKVIRTPDSPQRWAQPEGEGIEAEAGTVVFSDVRGDSIAVVTSGYATFAGATVPSDSVSLTGILMYGKFGGTKERFVLKLRDEYDVQR